MKTKIILVLLILLFMPLVFAGTYGEGVYGSGKYGTGAVIAEYCGDGACNNGETCSSCSADCGTCPVSSGGGSSSGGGGSTCDYDWECTEWFPSVCPGSGMQERICANKGDCSGIVGMPNQTRACEYLGPEGPLFDVYLTLSDENKELCVGEKIKANVRLENYGKVELLDAFMTYWVIDENNKLVAEMKDTRAVEKETNFIMEMKIPNSLVEGMYRLYVEITYDGNKTAVSGESFEVLSSENCLLSLKNKFNWRYLVYGFFAGIVLLLLVILVKVFWKKKRKTKKIRTPSKYKNKIKNNLRKIKLRSSLIVLVGFILIVFLFIGRSSMTGFVSKAVSGVSWNIFGCILIIGILGLLGFVFRKKIVWIVESKRRDSHSNNSLKVLIKKKVYAKGGDFIGKVEDVFLEGNRIESLKIKLDKKHKFRGVIVRYKDIIGVGRIIIVEDVLEYLK